MVSAKAPAPPSARSSRATQVITAWAAGLRLAASRGHDLGAVASVASFFVSRVDAAVDALLDEGDPRRGTTANAQVARAYALYLKRVASEPVRELLASGAQVQRPLWASTSTKNPAYYDLLYVDPIVADETVNTMPDATLAAAIDHGDFSASLLATEDGLRETAALVDRLPENVTLARVTEQLEVDGVAAFVTAYDELLGTVAAKLGDGLTRG